MGCCCSSRRAESNRRPHYIYCPRVVEIEPLSSTSGASSVVAAGLLVETNLEASILDTFRAPPTPLPYDVGIAGSQTLPGSLQNHGNKTDHMNLADSQPLDEADGRFESSALEKSDCKTKTDCWLESTKLTEDEPSKVIKPIASVVDEEDVCPTCLEEYDAENPRMMTKCEHYFHLSCILEWKERSDTCPICDQTMMINDGSNR